MEKRRTRLFQQALSILLCVAMMLPMIAVPGYATEVTEPVSVTAEATVPETTVPETTVPETTVPETTAPEATVPETTIPETTVPETTVPDDMAYFSVIGTELVDIEISDTISVPGYPASVSAKVSEVMKYDCGNGVTDIVPLE